MSYLLPGLLLMTTNFRRSLLPFTVALSAAISVGALSELPRTLITALPGELFGETIEGTATAADGDSLRIGNQRVRFWRIDAFELDQTCGDGVARVACGRTARGHLTRLVEGQVVVCVVQDHDHYGRAVAQCEANGIDLGEAMVEAGFAFDYPRYSNGFYAAAEIRARTAGGGVDSDNVIAPADWRARRRQDRREQPRSPRRAGRSSSPPRPRASREHDRGPAKKRPAGGEMMTGGAGIDHGRRRAPSSLTSQAAYRSGSVE
ncbi:thermonuclease family protein [Marinivivus vitaminiproducens]|uniref:thermonuclease family protein n=1 Tax=Marinivivus vitaminiproducens TaxID=3035935 RepID=UPI002798A64F|nr:thermonuclease family protein [Geminicoccaceae bacterium SCSIO 64248]WGF90918.1 thermonuclease family protein [Geminicoccaceae bacterium SCSIO 64248]